MVSICDLFFCYPICPMQLADAKCLMPWVQMAREAAPNYFEDGLGSHWEWYLEPVAFDSHLPLDICRPSAKRRFPMMHCHSPWTIRAYYYGPEHQGQIHMASRGMPGIVKLVAKSIGDGTMLSKKSNMRWRRYGGSRCLETQRSWGYIIAGLTKRLSTGPAKRL